MENIKNIQEKPEENNQPKTEKIKKETTDDSNKKRMKQIRERHNERQYIKNRGGLTE
ncbi:MAG: hypothetical protein M1334_02185 [Patescibacteria group bacterium]|nr:hypothetical protein [Patescibacteria group bacterium]